MSGAIVSHAGVRGRPGVELTDAVVADAVARLLALLEAPSLALGRDARPQSAALAERVAELAVRAGADVHDFGVVPTPTLKLAGRVRGLGGGIVVTGSHLPGEWNGLKLLAGPDFTPLDLRQMPPAVAGFGGRPGRLVRDSDAACDHAEAIAAVVDVDAIGARGLRVAVEGGTGTVIETVLSRIGALAANGHADIVLRLDPDGDRLALGDLDSEMTLPLTALAMGARSVVKGADTSAMVDLLVSRVDLATPGEMHLLAGLCEHGADLAGEGNGGVVVPAVGPARDGLATAAVLIDWLARVGEPLAAQVARLPVLHRRRSTVECHDDLQAATAVARLGGNGDAEVGVRVTEGPSSWWLVRRSATESVLRLTVEDESEQEADARHAALHVRLVEAAR